MSDVARLLLDLMKYLERNYDAMIKCNTDEGYILVETDEEVFVVSVQKDSLEDWGY